MNGVARQPVQPQAQPLKGTAGRLGGAPAMSCRIFAPTVTELSREQVIMLERWLVPSQSEYSYVVIKIGFHLPDWTGKWQDLPITVNEPVEGSGISVPEAVKNWDGNEWQSYIVRLLKLRYGPTGFQEVPDGHGGDFGLEGFSIADACAYQCYACEEPVSVGERYEKQRDKLTADVAKFKNNATDLAKLFGPLTIKNWLLVVPLHDSAKLVQHCATKTAEILSANLPYVAADFRVGVINHEAFTLERAKLLSMGIEKLQLDPANIAQETIKTWQASNTELIKRLDKKTQKIIPDEETAIEFRDRFIEYYMMSENMISELKSKFPDMHESFIKLKLARERHLRIESMLSKEGPKELLSSTVEKFKKETQSNLPGFSDATAESLAYGSAGDWLLRCPLDFPSKVTK